MKKSLKKLVVVTLSASVLVGVSGSAATILAESSEEPEVSSQEVSSESEETNESTSESETNEITKQELSEADGKDGNPAYVAVFGKVYDVTDNEAWPEGEHNGIQAGTDASEAFLESPHGIDLLEDLEEVGVYVDWELTTDQLSAYGPENENLRLIAVRGIVYDVTDVEAWAEGEHNGVQAGADVTETFTEESPHEDDLLEELPVVGRHIDYVFSQEELAEFDGQDGNRAYVAVDGVVYDMTNISAWEGGEHNGVQAGTDATDAFMNESPHEAEFLETLPVAGKYQ